MAPGRSHWRDAPDRALFPFGAGIGYTDFALSRLVVPARVAVGAPVPIRVTVTNRGTRPGEAFVRAGIHDRVASRTRPVSQMKAFARVAIAPAITTPTIGGADLALVAADGAWRIEPGVFDLRVTAGEDAVAETTFEVVPVV